MPGSPGFAKYLPFTADDGAWTMHRERDGHHVGVAKGTASFTVPLEDMQAKTQKLALRVFSETGGRTLSVRVNRIHAEIALAQPGWQTAILDARGELHLGENDLAVAPEDDKPVEVEWIQIGGEVGEGTDSAPIFYVPASHQLRVAAGQSLVYLVDIPTAANLVADVQAGCPVKVTAEAAEGAAITGHLAGAGARLDLSALAGRIARVEITADGCAEALFAHAALTVPGQLAAPHRAPPPRHIILWIMDSLRVDRVRTFVDTARPETPAWTALAARGTRFTHAYVQGNESRASHATIWTSLYPVNHGMIREGAKLDPKWITLGQAAHDSGLATAGQTANGYINARWGFATAWDILHNAIHEDGSTRGADALAGGLASLQSFGSKPAFLYLGTVDNHVSWRGKEPWLSRYDPGPYTGKYATIATGYDVDRMGPDGLQATPREKQRMIALSMTRT